jgi:protein-tyrosine phosphatase
MEWSTKLLAGRLNYSDITPQLAVGGSFRNGQIGQLQQRGVTAVVDCRQEAEDDVSALAKAGMAFLHLPAPDRYAMRDDQLREGVGWVLDHVRTGGRAYLHCEHGVGRGPLLAAAVLVAQGYSAADALHLVRSRRWQAMPNDRQLEALDAFERQWRADVTARCDPPG